MSEPRWIQFFEQPPIPGRKTRIWLIAAKDGQGLLGRIAWYGAWRKYIFAPTLHAATVYEERCLRDIAEFIEIRTTEHRLALAAACAAEKEKQ